MENVNLNIMSRRLMALAAIASGLALSPQSVMAASSVQIVQSRQVRYKVQLLMVMVKPLSVLLLR